MALLSPLLSLSPAPPITSIALSSSFRKFFFIFFMGLNFLHHSYQILCDWILNTTSSFIVLCFLHSCSIPICLYSALRCFFSLYLDFEFHLSILSNSWSATLVMLFWVQFYAISMLCFIFSIFCKNVVDVSLMGITTYLLGSIGLPNFAPFF